MDKSLAVTNQHRGANGAARPVHCGGKRLDILSLPPSSRRKAEDNSSPPPNAVHRTFICAGALMSRVPFQQGTALVHRRFRAAREGEGPCVL